MLPAIDLTSPAHFPYATTAPIPDLTDEEAKKEIELLGMTFNPDTEIPVPNLFIIICSGLNEKGEINNYIEFVYMYTKQSSNTILLSRIWDNEYIFEFPENDCELIGQVTDGVLISPRYESLRGVELERVTVVSNLYKLCNEYGIRIKKIDTPFGEAIYDCQHTDQPRRSFTYEEIADYYVRAFAEENRMTAVDYTDPIPYTPRTPAP